MFIIGGDMQAYLEKLTSLFTQPNLAKFSEKIKPDIIDMQNFRFYFTNPVFGIIILVTFLILSRSWGFKKSFSYCLVVSTILYLTTKIASYTSIPIEGSQILYADIIKFIALFIITLISIYYFLIRTK
jgi:hypothetical protein